MKVVKTYVNEPAEQLWQDCFNQKVRN